MPTIDWSTNTFWSQKAPLIEAAAHRWGVRDGREAYGALWETLSTRFPGGRIEGPNPKAYLDKTIAAEAAKYFRKEARRRQKIAGRRRVSIDLAGDSRDATSSPVEGLIKREAPVVVGVLLQGLSRHDRELIEARYGFGREAASTSEIAEVLQVSRQAVLKNIRRIEDRLRRRIRRLHLTI